jgi:hypothetical protein
LVVLVASQLSVLGLYLPPVFTLPLDEPPPQMTISFGVQTAVCESRAEGTLVALVGVHVSVLGLYLPPVLTEFVPSYPPHTIISLPVQIAV